MTKQATKADLKAAFEAANQESHYQAEIIREIINGIKPAQIIKFTLDGTETVLELHGIERGHGGLVLRKSSTYQPGGSWSLWYVESIRPLDEDLRIHGSNRYSDYSHHISDGLNKLAYYRHNYFCPRPVDGKHAAGDPAAA